MILINLFPYLLNYFSLHAMQHMHAIYHISYRFVGILCGPNILNFFYMFLLPYLSTGIRIIIGTNSKTYLSHDKKLRYFNT